MADSRAPLAQDEHGRRVHDAYLVVDVSLLPHPRPVHLLAHDLVAEHLHAGLAELDADSLVVDDLALNVDGLVQELLGLLKLMLLQVNASQIVHATALLLSVLELFENLSHLMVVQQGLVVVAFVEGVPRHIDGLGEIAESKVKRIDLIIPRPIVQHDVSALVLLLLLVCFPIVLFSKSMLFIELLFLINCFIDQQRLIVEPLY